MDNPCPETPKVYSDSATDEMFRKQVETDFERVNERMDTIEAALESNAESVDQRLDAVETAIEGNTKTTNQTHQNTAELVEIFQAAKGGFKVVGWLGNAAKWTAGIAVAVIGVWKTMDWKWPFN